MVNVIPYVPRFLLKPPKLANVPTAWDGVESILLDAMHAFKIKQNVCLEFGVDYGYSTSALANCFKHVIGVDTFMGDINAGYRDNLLAQASEALKEFPNIRLIQMDYRDYIKSDLGKFDLIHIDIVHSYKETNELAHWAIHHSDVVMCHDTIAFPDVRRACEDVAWESNRKFYEYQVKHGVGFLVKE